MANSRGNSLPRTNRPLRTQPQIKGIHAILGMDIVGFSKLSESRQHEAVAQLFQWVRAALEFNGIDTEKEDFVWSHAGDGGYLTFLTHPTESIALSVGFDIARRAKSYNWSHPDTRLLIRLAVHAGFVQQTVPLGLGIWKEVSGAGINTTARIVSLSAPGQFLMSRQYFDTYLRGQPPADVEIGPLHTRSVKHGVRVEVMNVDQDGLCMSQGDATAFQWEAISNLWQQMIIDYEALVHDSLKAGSTLTAIAAAHYLMKFGRADSVEPLCKALGTEQHTGTFNFPVERHELLGRLPASLLMEVIRLASTRMIETDGNICTNGDPAETCFFVVCGKAVIERPGNRELLFVRPGTLLGEFSLWMTGLRRTATIRALSKTLIVEIPISRFHDLLDKNRGGEMIHEQIRRRVIEHVVSSRELFPGAENTQFKSITCQKFAPGSKLDLGETVFILFNGEVEIYPARNLVRRLVAHGRVVPEGVVGILSRLGSPDGKTARTICETVAVTISKEELAKLQQENPSVKRAWDGFCGIRLAELKDLELPLK